MRKTADMKHRLWMMVITMVSLSLLWSLSVPSVARAQQSSDICVVQIAAQGKVIGIFANTPQNFTIAVLVPTFQKANVPVPCDLLSTLSLAVANQEAHDTTVNLQVFTHDGVSICVKDGFTVPVNGGRGATFADCQ